ncbi:MULTISPECIES: NAD-dependent epimerase/dehydratase family protein [Streptomyces]|uniref:Reductase n=1 Tax=Streptomyces tsukubensis (strain DSM 42081 / NBRC 108919 / NRRL 18488 / 9993) TaxID=1114943 RepID=I2MX74_STRT9|nr:MULTISPECIES: NAD-dependent epimerase/dehydratase family protein [Streptomyces]AZK93764.1 reductase [Streptomyces tsukubensis]EIF89371.1 reductase [Streptomyces tsukubensis NRRL18488]MYS66929.1 NAD-dependent epimerase/dehydratase family protein [Streptomyces sp. SID5473]QKM70098.1 reductase [Streptomyces tsukubensis NRRL18488]TAI45926.1 NAD-dependent epimerase/dehydratase family protein [Streptomyces tsukubensis]
MRVLILGGTEFAGRAVVAAALARGWDVTVFNRGTRPVPEGVTALTGDRTRPSDLAVLADGSWDVVVDTWAAAPTAVRDAARLLADRAGRYVYVSSCSVYTWPAPPDSDESAPLVTASADGEDGPYAEAKRGGELAAAEAFGTDRSLLVRAGLLLGPWENIGRLPWWLSRIARGGTVLAPGPADAPVQYIDVRDMAEWILSAAAAGLSGPYNMVGEQRGTTFGDVLAECVRVVSESAPPKAVSREPVELRWTPAERILAAGVSPWTDLPIWVPPQAADLMGALYTLNVGRAEAAGLRCRPLAETVADTWEWLRGVGGELSVAGVGISPETEARLLAG